VDTRVAEREAKAITAIEAVQAAVLSAALTSFWLVVTPLVQQPACCDAGEYLRLARDPTSPMLRPYSMRVLVPWLVHALGGDVVTTFHAVSLVCLAITGWLMYLLARQLGVAHGYALLATAALLCSRGWLFFFYDPYLTEPAAFLLLTAAFLVLVRNRRTWLIAPLLVLMAATREQFIGFALPTYFWLSHRHLDWRALSQTIGLLLPALVVFAALATLPHVLPPTPFSQPMGFAYTLDRRMEGDGWLWFASAFAMSLGVWWPLAVASLRVDRFRRLSWWLIPVLAYLILIGWDWSRYAMYAFPVVMAAGGGIGRSCWRWSRSRPYSPSLISSPGSRRSTTRDRRCRSACSSSWPQSPSSSRAIDADRLVRNDPTWLVRPSRCRTGPSSVKLQAAPRNSRGSDRQWGGPSLNPVAKQGSRRGRYPKPDHVFADGRAFLD
jgi:hypothetical protein